MPSYYEYAVKSLLAVLAIICAAISSVSAITLTVAPVKALADEPISITVSGLTPEADVSLVLTTRDRSGRIWQSQATFKADSTGLLDLRRAAPISGTYSGVDPMGLFWSMQPPPSDTEQFIPPASVLPAKGSNNSVAYTLSGSATGYPPRSVVLERRLVASDVRLRRIRKGSLVADLFYPVSYARDKKKHAALVVLGGSEGGISGADELAAWYASHGFIALATAYFGIAPLPKNLIKVPIETVEDAVKYLAQQPFVDSQSIGVSGISWGGNLALLSASYLPQIKAVVSWVGAPILFSGLSFERGPVNESPFTHRGEPLPFISYQIWMKFYPAMSDKSLIDKSFIPIERIRGPVLFVAGEDDTLGLSGVMARLGVERLRRLHHPYADEALIYASAGHLIFPEYWSTANQNSQTTPYGVLQFGGTPKGNAHADADCGFQAIRFLRSVFSKSNGKLTIKKL